MWVQGANNSAFIGAREDLPLTVYGNKSGTKTLLAEEPLPWRVGPGEVSKAVGFTLASETWSSYESLTVVIDEPDSASEWGGAKECDEDDNDVEVDLSAFCP